MADLPDDDELWAMREEITWRDLSDEYGLAPCTVGYRLNKRGWRKQRKTGSVTRAPCADCGKSRAIEDLDERRICECCRADDGPPDPRALLYTQESTDGSPEATDTRS